MNWRPVDDPDILRDFCLRDPGRYLFHLGDLDPAEWVRSDYFGLEGPKGLAALLLVYRGLSRPCVLAFGGEGALGDALEASLPLLPASAFYHGFDADLRRLAGRADVTRRGRFRRMTWHGFPAMVAGARRARRLGPEDLDDLLELYAEAYPDAHFEPVQLEKSFLYGVREEGRLLSVAGLHVYSEREGVAMLGNIATRPERRGEGLGAAVTAALLGELAGRLRWIGLNVHVENAAARRIYLRLGFQERFVYEEAEYVMAQPSRPSS